MALTLKELKQNSPTSTSCEQKMLEREEKVLRPWEGHKAEGDLLEKIVNRPQREEKIQRTIAATKPRPVSPREENRQEKKVSHINSQDLLAKKIQDRVSQVSKNWTIDID